MWTLTNQPPSEGVRFQAVFHRTVNGRKETATRHLRKMADGNWWGLSLDPGKHVQMMNMIAYAKMLAHEEMTARDKNWTRAFVPAGNYKPENYLSPHPEILIKEAKAA